jgi:hypothetical protein
MLEVRTVVMNGTYERDHIAIGPNDIQRKTPGKLATPNF